MLAKNRLAKPYEMDELFGDKEIVTTCCRYIHLAFMATIAQNEAGTIFSGANELARHLSDWQLLPYALDNLAIHLNHLGLKHTETISSFEKLIEEVTAKPASYASLLLFRWIRYRPWPNPLSISTEPGVAKECIDYTLVCAATDGHTNAVDILLILGASPTKALYPASYSGQAQTVEILLTNKADVNAQGEKYGNALQAAASCGHDSIVWLLLSHGADVNALGGEYGNALQAASAAGYRSIVQQLLRRGADVNASGGSYGSALQAALSGGHHRIVKMLIKGGADVNAQGSE